jgi:hypothetical protein
MISRPRMVRTALKIQEVTLVCANCFQMVDEIAAVVGISHVLATTSCLMVNMSHVTQHNVSHVLTQDQHNDCISICGELISSADRDGTFLNRIITGDKTWCCLYDPHLAT